MNIIIDILTDTGFVFMACYIANIVAKVVVTKIISNNEMSDIKSGQITRMMSKYIKIKNQ